MNIMDEIVVRGAREHNLKDVNVTIHKNALTVITGLSGSGKSSLAFDTIYAEGQRRFIDSLSTYARNFLFKLNKPDVDSITGLCPSIAIDQKTVGHSPRSTVGTITEIYDYLRLLFSKVGTPKCPEHDIPVAGQTQAQIVSDILENFMGQKLIILAAVATEKKGEFKKEIDGWIQSGYVSAKIDGHWVNLDNVPPLKKTHRHNIELIVDKIILKDDDRSKNRLAEAIQSAVEIGSGFVTLESKSGDRRNFSTSLACPECGYSFPELDPLSFSFNNPKGACEDCSGLGTQDIEEVEVSEYSPGSKSGTRNYVDWKLNSENPDMDWSNTTVCSSCEGSGLKPMALNVYFEGYNILEVGNLSLEKLHEFMSSVGDENSSEVLKQIQPELLSRLNYLLKVGAGYLSLSRRSKTLSGGEAQRIRLASQVGTPLIGVLYVLDEPSIGLHPRDHDNVLSILKEIRDRGNTVIVVEHDERTIESADYIVDIGPLAGRNGGKIIFSGPTKDLIQSEGLTADYLAQRRSVPLPEKRRTSNGMELVVEGSQGNNLQNVTARFPLGTLIGVSGVSGSGKSTLIIDTLYKSLANHFLKRSFVESPHKKITGVENIHTIIQIDQKPIGRTPRSCPATYVGVFPLIRTLFSQVPESKIRGYDIGRFSFNVKGGRCEVCQGAGLVRVRMQFLSDVYVQCDSCNGKRYNPETLLIKYKGKTISDILSMDVEEAHQFFENHKSIQRKLSTLMKVGLNYITLGQSSTTLSGGEAQRIKLSRELSKKTKGHTLYILDEPTTGLHVHDVSKLVELLNELVDRENTVVVVEHNLDVIKSCDVLIDLGPEGGDKGGEIVFTGTPEELVLKPKILTSKYLKPLIK